MTAPGTPNLGAVGSTPGGESVPGRRRVSSVSGSPWQLVEVSNVKAAAVRSTPASPNIQFLRTPPTIPLAAPATLMEDDEDAMMPAAAVASGWADWLDEEASGAERQEEEVIKRRPSRPPRKQEEDDGFDPAYFVGDWLDNLGHKILVVPGNPNRGAPRRRGGGGGGPRQVYLATLVRPGVPEKRFNISRDRGKQFWTCGNGSLVSEESNMEVLVWKAGDGRMSRWSRAPPEGPVYFDAPPEGQVPSYFGPEDAGPPMGPVYFDPPQDFAMHAQPQGPPVYFDPPPGTPAEEHGTAVGTTQPPSWVSLPPGAAPPGPFYFVMQQPMDWKELHLPTDEDPKAPAAANGADGEEPAAAAASGEGEEPAAAPAEEPAPAEPVEPAASAAPAASAGLNPAAAEFVPGGFLAAAAAPPPAAAAPAAAAAPRSRAPSSAVSTPAPSPHLGATPVPVQRWSHSPKMGAVPSPASHRSSWGRTPSPSPMMGPLPPPQAGRQAGLLPPAAAPVPPEPPAVEFPEEHPDVHVEGSTLEWSLPENWGRLIRYAKDFCLHSPMFGVKGCPNMQLAFYPNGSRAAEVGQCTVALMRGPDSAGIKFEFRVNGRSIGPKVCLGRRYLGDYPRPFDDSEESKTSKVTVCMQVLEMLGVPD